MDAARRFFNLEEAPAGCMTEHGRGPGCAGRSMRQAMEPAGMSDTSLIPQTTKEQGRGCELDEPWRAERVWREHHSM